MAFLKSIQIVALAALPVLCLAQDSETKGAVKPTSSATDCPSWNTKRPNNRADFLEYMRNAKGKRVDVNNPYLATAKTLSNISSPTKNTEQKFAAKNDFYTRKRYNLFPDKPAQNNSEASKKYNDIPAGSTTYEPIQQTDPAKKETVPINNAQTSVVVTEQKITQEVSTPAPAPEQNEQTVKTKESGSTKVESNKTHTSWLKKKFTRLFSKKTNSLQSRITKSVPQGFSGEI